MTQLLAFLLCFTSFSCFALIKNSHCKAVFAKRVDAVLGRRMLMIAWCALITSIIISLWDLAGYGGVLFFGYMAISIILLVLLLSYHPTKLRSLIYVLPTLISATCIGLWL
ncbi:DUF3325 family protein [Pseudoalteromonas sp. MMG012]|uniref:DUF3325 family protein n=1 Tax=Pseudoalteromonas sp. MMG012 TaxID=2822686 RepID=UPI001B39DD6E|nr:DUF3325 family protein [Pseudoalteromonas sp. MMG012]